MAAAAAVLLLYISGVAALTSATDNNSTDFIRARCSATLYPSLCFRSLSPYACSVLTNPVYLARAAANVSLAHARSVSSHVFSLSSRASPGLDAAVLRDSIESMGDAVDQIKQSADEIGKLEAAAGPAVAWRVANAQTWMSAALTNEETCTDGFDAVSGSSPVKADVCRRVSRPRGPINARSLHTMGRGQAVGHSIEIAASIE